MKKILQAAATGLALMLLCGFAYPLLVLGIGKLAFNSQSSGSIIYVNGKAVGSELIGQDFSESCYFRGRPSAVYYDTFAGGTALEAIRPSSGSFNYSTSSQALRKRVAADIAEFLKDNPTVEEKDLPADLFTASASGLDPDISPAAANIQVARVSSASGIPKARVEHIIADCTSGPQLGIFGEYRVNVLKANLEIYRLMNNK
jgi:potassium-transporting ATPase KdpC subunit